MTKQKQICGGLCSFLNLFLNITFTYVFRPFPQYFVEAPLAVITALSLLGTPVFREFLPFFFADPLKLCQVGWGASLHRYSQVSPEIIDWVQVRTLAGRLKDIQRLVPKPLLRCLGCVLRVIVLLDGEPLPLSEVLSPLE